MFTLRIVAESLLSDLKLQVPIFFIKNVFFKILILIETLVQKLKNKIFENLDRAIAEGANQRAVCADIKKFSKFSSGNPILIGGIALVKWRAILKSYR